MNGKHIIFIFFLIVALTWIGGALGGKRGMEIGVIAAVSLIAGYAVLRGKGKENRKAAFCSSCNRDVGIIKQRPWFGTIILLLTGFSATPISFGLSIPIFLLAAAFYYRLKSKSVCGICKVEILKKAVWT